MSKIYGEDVRSKMVLAMHRRTRPGCEESLQQAIDLVPTHTVRNYIMKNYVNNTEKWALYARQHSPLLLQVTTTNAVESYHSELKSTTSPSHGLIGASIKTAKLDEKKSQDAKRAALQFRTRKLSWTTPSSPRSTSSPTPSNVSSPTRPSLCWGGLRRGRSRLD
jgi:hypothetical protein